MIQKPTIIFLHGALGSAVQLDDLANLMRENNDVHVLDFLGHGKQNLLSGKLSVELLCTQLEEYISNHQLVSPLIFGYSLGGYVALCTSHRHPKSIGKIICLGTKFAWNPQVVNEQFGFLDPEKIKSEMPGFAAGLKELHGEKWEILTQQTFGLVQSLAKNSLLNELTLSKIQIPVCIMRGEKDKMVSEEESVQTAAHIALGKYFCLANTPHHLEKVDVIMLKEKIQEFFD
ncbi:MAG: alpha/beta hydrolase [Saprospiraceae bacterium]|nr:alpha/beta hydrolase [Saprospiraceae bacterium]MBK7811059.1 alpha/beta hydrolase [Saprospiraceae bacterium]MBK9630663.1 alpha/beta hydrolase [Saprospiraceae bacterium]